MIAFHKYTKIKNKYVISYFGSADEYLIQLLHIRPFIEKELPGIEIYISSSDNSYHLISHEEKTLPYSSLKNKKNDFSYIRELKCDMHSHPVLEIIKESGIPVSPPVPQDEYGNRCIIVPTGVLPTISLNKKQIDQCFEIGKDAGFEVSVSNDISGAGLVIGVESPSLFKAGILGIGTILINTGIGGELYKMLFPAGRIEKL